uniref:Conserved plasma membrane protein n=1 Tax=Anisakis simplex TaxID=6269 RepID=A0A0M3K4I7_ANISI
LSLACEVAGTDPTYGFPRTCDASSAQRLFQTTSENTVVCFSLLLELLCFRLKAIEGITPTKDAKRDVESGKMLIELQGKCFNATVAVKKYTVRCPWCPDPNSLALVEHQYMGNEPAAEMSQDVESRDHLLHLGVILLSTIAVISSTAFMCLLVAFLRQKRSSALSNKQRRYGAYHQQCQQVHVDRQFHSDESRYETPWEQKYRPIPYWVGNKSDLVAVPPPSVIETSSMIGGDALSGHTSRTTIIGTMGRLHHSPNSSSNGAPGASDTHEDSGLESV